MRDGSVYPARRGQWISYEDDCCVLMGNVCVIACVAARCRVALCKHCYSLFINNKNNSL